MTDPELVRIKARPKTKGSWQDRRDGEFWLDHVTIRPADLPRLASARHLTLWNVKLPAGFFGQLPLLRSLDLRGGSAKTLDPIREAGKLQRLSVSHVRGLADLSAIADIADLESLSLYALAQVTHLPSLHPLGKLRRVQLGQMRQLSDLSPVAAAPALEELVLIRKLA